MPITVLVADDDDNLRAMIRRGLNSRGYCVREARDGREALAAATGDEPDLMVLDIGMPYLDGIETCRLVRSQSNVPILLLTARADVDDRVIGLRTGADDYLSKPFAFEELVARLESLARRARLASGDRLAAGDITLDTATRTVTRAGQGIELTRREFDLLELLLRHPGRVLETGTIWRRVWGEDLTHESNALIVAFSTLRRKLGAPNPIETVRGVGYRLVS